MGEPGVCEAPEEVEKEGERGGEREKEGERGGEREKEVRLRGREFQEKKNGKGRREQGERECKGNKSAAPHRKDCPR